MAEKKRRGAPRFLRPLILLLVLGGIGFAVWRYQHRKEGYHGGDVVTTGTVEAVHVQLAFKVGGRLADVPVSEGRTVQAGGLIGRVEPQDLEVQVAAARAALESARAGLAQAEANRDKAASDFKRISGLIASDATTAQQVDASRAAAEVASAQVLAAHAQVSQAETALSQAQLQLSYAELRAPVAGEISEKIHHAGEMVMAGTPVVTLAELDTVKVNAAVDETRVGAVRPGDPVQVRVYTFDNQVFTGRVTSIEPVGEFATRKDWGAQRRDIRTFTVTAHVPNAQHLLKDGMTAEVTIQVSPSVQRMAEAKP
jgi:RND family efflux transporter MFP subunit